MAETTRYGGGAGGSPSPPAWRLIGNAGTTYGTNFIGTTDNVALSIKTNDVEAIAIDTAQNVGIGTSSPAAKLDVAGTVKSDAILADGDTYGIDTGDDLLGYGLSGMSLTNKTTGYGVYQLNFTPFGGDINTTVLGNPTDKNFLIDPNHALLKVPATEIRSDVIDLNASNGASRISQLANEYIFDNADISGNTIGTDALVAVNEVHNACQIGGNVVTGGIGNAACAIQFNRLWDNSQINNNQLTGDGTYIWDVIAGEACQVNTNTLSGLNAYFDNITQHDGDKVRNNTLSGIGSYIKDIRQFGQSDIKIIELSADGSGVNRVMQMSSLIDRCTLNVAGNIFEDLFLHWATLENATGISVKRLFLVNAALDLTGQGTDIEDVNIFGGFTKLGPKGTNVLPTATLHVEGSLRYVDGNEGVGKVLTSDANGNASWTPPTTTVMAVNYLTPATGDTVTVTSGSSNIIDPGGNIAALTVSLPSTPANGQQLQLAYMHNIITLTYINGTVHPNSIRSLAGTHDVLTFVAAQNTWF